MKAKLPVIRLAGREDDSNILELIRIAFSGEDLTGLTEKLLSNTGSTFALVAEVGSRIAGVIFFTRASVTGADLSFALLGPLAVVPACQHSGIGSALVRNGFAEAAKRNIAEILVLGDPAYYGRFGFREESGISPPYELPAEWLPAWQSVSLTETHSASGTLEPGAIWMDQALWLP
jgi:putative acetyltransferase